MSSEFSDMDLNRLLADGAWANALARSLVGEHDGQDLTQEVLAKAMRKPSRPGVTTRAYWTQALRWEAASLRRVRASRLRRERCAARKESDVPGPGEILETLEQRRLLAEHLMALPEPLRYVLVLRYEKGWNAREIGECLDLSASAVRDRLSKARKLLRARLQDSNSDWRRALLPLAFPKETAQAPLIPLALTMNAKTLTLVALLIVSVIGFGAWTIQAQEGDQRDDLIVAPAPPLQSSSDQDLGASEPAAPARQLASKDEMSGELAGESEDDADRIVTLSGLVSSPNGDPIPNVRVELRYMTGSAKAWGTAGETDSEGRYQLIGEEFQSWPLVLEFSAEGYERTKLHGIAGSGVFHATLQPQVVVFSGRVLDPKGGGCTEAQMNLWGMPDNGSQEAIATVSSDRNGEFEFPPVCEGRYYISAAKFGVGACGMEYRARVQDPVVSLELRLLEALAERSLLVVDDDTGEALEGVSVRTTLGYHTKSDRWGRFELFTSSRSPDTISFWVNKPGYQRSVQRRDVEDNLEQPVRMVREGFVAVRIVGVPDGGQPIGEFSLFVDSMGLITVPAEVELLGNGEFLLSALGVSAQHGAFCVFEGQGLCRQTAIANAFEPGVTDPASLPTVQAAAGRSLSILVLDALTKLPLAGTQVGRGIYIQQLEKPWHARDHVNSTRSSHEESAYTNTKGRTVLRGIHLGDSCVAVVHDGYVSKHELVPMGAKQMQILLDPEPPLAEVLAGRVTSSTGGSIVAGSVTAITPSGQRFPSTVNSKGEFVVLARSAGPFGICAEATDSTGGRVTLLTKGSTYPAGTRDIVLELKEE